MKLKRLMAGVLSAAMLLSVGSSLAFADENTVEVDTSAKTMSFTSSMYLSDTAVSEPGVVYTYRVTTGAAGSYTTEDTNGDDMDILVSAGVFTGTGETTVSISATATFVLGTAATTSTVTKEVTLDFSDVVFPEPGVYHYIVTETNDIDGAKGFVNESDATRDVYVTVINGTKGYEIDNIIMTTASFTDTAEGSVEYSTAIKSEGYIHSYGIAADDDEPDDDDETVSQNFVITDVAKGSLASRDKEFEFDGELEVTTNAPAGTVFAVSTAAGSASVDDAVATDTIVIVGADNVLYPATLSEGIYVKDGTDAFTFSLKSGEVFVIYTVVEDMSFTVTISDPDTANENGYSFYHRTYVATFDASDLVAWTATTGEAADYVVDGDYTENEGIDFATVKGQKEDDEIDDEDIVYAGSFPETGVVLDLAPYAIMMVLAAGFIVFRAARKTEE